MLRSPARGKKRTPEAKAASPGRREASPSWTNPALTPLLDGAASAMHQLFARRASPDLRRGEEKLASELSLDAELAKTGLPSDFTLGGQTCDASTLSSGRDSQAPRSAPETAPHLQLGPRFEALAMSSQGQRLAAVAPSERRVVLCDVEDLGNVTELVYPPCATVPTRHVCAAFLADLGEADAFLVVGDHPGYELYMHIHVWDLRDRTSPYRGVAWIHAPPVDCIAISAAGAHLALGGPEGILRLWDLTEVASLTCSAAATPAAKANGFKAEADGGKSSVLWMAPAGDLRSHARCVRPGDLLALAFRSDGAYLAASADEDAIIGPCVRIWATRDLHRIMAAPTPVAIVTDYATPAVALSFSADGERIATAHQGSGTMLPASAASGDENAILVWSMTAASEASRTGAAPGPLRALSGHTGRVTSLSFSPDGRRLLSTADDAAVLLHDVSRQGEAVSAPLRSFPVGSDPPEAVAFSQKGREVVAATADAALRVWPCDGSGERQERLQSFPHDATADGAALVTLGSMRGPESFVSASALGLRTWTLDGAHVPPGQPQPRAARSFAVVEGELACLASSPNGRFVATASWHGAVQVRRVDAAASPSSPAASDDWFQLEDASGIGVSCLAFAPDSATLATGANDGQVRLWHTAVSFRAAAPNLAGAASRITAMAFLSADGNLLAATAEDGFLRIWDRTRGAVDGRPIQLIAPLLSGSPALLTAAVSHGLLASASPAPDAPILLWEILEASHAPPLRLRSSIAQGSGALTALALSPSGEHVAAGARDGVVSVWDVRSETLGPSSPQLVRMLEPPSDPGRRGPKAVTSIVFGHSGLAWATRDGFVHVLRMPQPATSLLTERPSIQHAKRAWFAPELAAVPGHTWPRLRPVLERFPSLLWETSNFQRSLLQAVVVADRKDAVDAMRSWGLPAGSLLAAVLAPPPGHVDGPGSSKALSGHRAPPSAAAAFPCPNGAFLYAMRHRDAELLALLFDLLEDAFAGAQHRGALNTVQRAAHETDAFHHTTLSCALRSHPRVALGFLKRLRLAQAYDLVLGEEASLARCRPPHPDAQILCGTTERSPPGYWARRVPQAWKLGSMREVAVHADRPRPTGWDAVDDYESKRRTAEKDRVPWREKLAAACLDPFDETGASLGGVAEAGGPAAYLLPIKGIAGPGSTVLKDAVDACDALGEVDALASPVLEALIEFKWRRIARRRYRTDGLLAGALLVTFTAAVVLLPEAIVRDEVGLETAGLVLVGVFANLWFYFIWKERRAAGGFGRLAGRVSRNYWVAITVGALVLQLAAVVVLLKDAIVAMTQSATPQREDFLVSTIAAALALPASWYAPCRYFAADPGSALLLRTKAALARDVPGFFLMLALVLGGFTSALYLLFTTGPDMMELGQFADGEAIVERVAGYDNPWKSLVSTFGIVLGDVERQTWAASANESATTVVVVGLQVVGTVLLLSLLVAIMSGAHAEVRVDARAHHLRAKARLVLAYEAEARRRGRYGNDPSRWPQWIQVLRARMTGSMDRSAPSSVAAVAVGLEGGTRAW